MRMVSTNEFRDNLAEYIDNVSKNETPLVISRFGKPLVEVKPYKKRKQDNFDKFYGFMGNDVDGETYLNRIRRSKKERDYVKKLRNGQNPR